MRYPKRLPMKQWIRDQLDSKSYPGLRWINKSRGKFQISWKHGSLQDWSWDDDVRVFRGWAIYTGKYQPREDVTADADLELAKKWKTNFRCALNVLPGLEMIKEESNARGANAKKVYIMKPDKKSKKRRKQKETLERDTTDMSPLSRGIDQQDIDEIEKELSQSTTLVKKDDSLFAIQDLFDNGELFQQLEPIT